METEKPRYWIRFCDGELPPDLAHLERSELVILEGGISGPRVFLSLGPEVSERLIDRYRETVAEYAARKSGGR